MRGEKVATFEDEHKLEELKKVLDPRQNPTLLLFKPEYKLMLV
jgi:hypothetical protein